MHMLVSLEGQLKVGIRIFDRKEDLLETLSFVQGK
jgi:hypothetical protein